MDACYHSNTATQQRINMCVCVCVCICTHAYILAVFAVRYKEAGSSKHFKYMVSRQRVTVINQTQFSQTQLKHRTHNDGDHSNRVVGKQQRKP